MRPVASFLLFTLLGCAHLGPGAGARVDVLVIAPHPDDEVLLAAGVLGRAVREGRRAEVVLVTNGDRGCGRDGTQRQAESIDALAALGVAESAVHFLGYPDGHLSALGPSPLPAVERRLPDGTCGTGQTTWASRGADGRDEHRARTGAPATWTAEHLTGDLAALLARLRPRHVYLPHPLDEHPDHAMTYVYFRRALDRLPEAPLVHRGVVHAGACWPSDCATFYAPGEALPPLPAPLAAYAPPERLEVDAAWKLGLITRYRSQTGPAPTGDWLASFARRDEAFFPESYQRLGGRWVRAPLEETRVLAVVEGPGPLHEGVRVHGEPGVVRLVGEGGVEWARFARPPGALTLRIDPAPAAWEWSLFGPDGLIGVAVVPRSAASPAATSR